MWWGDGCKVVGCNCDNVINKERKRESNCVWIDYEYPQKERDNVHVFK